MARHLAVVRVAAGVSATAMIVAVFTRLLLAPLPPDRVWEELGLGVASVAYAMAAVAGQRSRAALRPGLVLLQGVVPGLLITGILAAAGPALQDRLVICVLVFAAILIGLPARAEVLAVLGTAVVVLALLTAAWVGILGGDLGTLLIAVIILAAIEVFIVSQFHVFVAGAATERMRSTAHGVTAMNVGTAIDLSAVSRAVITTCREAFPLTTQASILLHEPSTGRLRPLPVQLSPEGRAVASEEGATEITIAPGEGMAGKVYTANRPMLWPTALDVNLAQCNLPEAVRRGAQPYRRGPILSAIGAPLVVDDEVIGVYLLASQRQELAWEVDDLPVVAALAAEAARAIERARRYERDLDAAHLDSVTGLANHRQLQRTLDQEVARARRRNSALGVVFCDLDRFKSVNDLYGHAAGDRVLTILATVFHESLRREDSAARYGGDEFVCVLPGADRAEADAVGQRISSSLEARVRADPEIAASGVTISCGIATFPDDADSVEGLLDSADAAMRAVKLAHRGSVGSHRPGG
ncbi:MAG: GGDEF domain-containing protein [Candidatus Dormibacteria bacterium]